MRLVNRDSATRWARRLVVKSDVGELFNVRSREAISALFLLAPRVLMVGLSSSLRLDLWD